MDEDNNVIVDVDIFASVDDDSAASITAALAESGIEGTEVGALGSAPLGEILIAASVALPALARTVNSLRNSFRKGVVIDAYHQQLVIRQAPELPRGHVVVRGPNGELIVQDSASLQATLEAATAPDQVSPQATSVTDAAS